MIFYLAVLNTYILIYVRSYYIVHWSDARSRLSGEIVPICIIFITDFVARSNIVIRLALHDSRVHKNVRQCNVTHINYKFV